MLFIVFVNVLNFIFILVHFHFSSSFSSFVVCSGLFLSFSCFINMSM